MTVWFDGVDEAPLADLVVVEVAGDVAGQFCGKSLADLGARVIKIEPPDGDPLRSVGPFPPGDAGPDAGALFLWLNTNKESVAMDRASASGAALFERILDRADVLIVSADAGLDVRVVSADHPWLVVATVTPFGASGPHAAWQADDAVLAAMTGWMHMTGKPDREPLGTFETLPSAITGLAAASAVLMAAHERRASGQGQVVEVAAQEVLALCTAYISLAYSYNGFERPRSGMPFPMTIVPAADGYLGINVLTQAQWEGLCSFAGLDELLAHPDYETPLLRAQHAAELTERFVEWARDRERAEVFHAGQQWRVPFGYVARLAEVLELEPHLARGFFQEAEGWRYPRPPFLIRGLPQTRPAPRHGADTEKIAADAGQDAAP